MARMEARRIARRLPIDDSAVEDMTQEIVLRLLRVRERYQPEICSVWAFCRKQAMGAALDFIRSKNDVNQHTGFQRLSQMPVFEDDGEEIDLVIRDVNADPRREVIEQETADLIQQSITMLSSRHQFIVRSYFWADLTLSEIAEMMGVNESRVSQMLDAALDRLSAALAGRGICQ